MDPLQALLPALSSNGHPQKIELLGWYLHTHLGKTAFWPSDVERLYAKLSLAPPSGFGGYFQNLAKQKILLKDKLGYRLESAARQRLTSVHGTREVTLQLTALLANLPSMVPSLVEKTYLNEALICYRHGAFRAAVVMTWNLAYHHLCSHVLSHRLADFNSRWQLSFPGHHKKTTLHITSMDDFNRELKESEVIEICRLAQIITSDVARVMVEKLGRRNSAAHPSALVIEQLQVDAFIDDLVRNVVLKIA
jgi:hypothetical protein